MGNSVQRKGHDAAETILGQRGTKHPQALDGRKRPKQVASKCLHLGFIGFKTLGCLGEGGRHPGRAGDVGGAGPVAALLRAAMHERGGHDAVRAHEGAHAARPVELVGRDAHEVKAVAREVDLHMAGSLHGVGVEERAALAAHAADVAHGLQRPNLVVGIHERDQAGVLAHGGLHGLHVHDAKLVRLNERNLEVATERPVRARKIVQRAKDARVLDGAGHDVALALASAVGGTREQGLVVGLGAARGELHLVGAGMQGVGDAAARALERTQGSVSGGMLAGRVGEGVARSHGVHGFDGRRAHPRGGRVVEIDVIHAFQCRRLRAIKTARRQSRASGQVHRVPDLRISGRFDATG